MSSTSAVHLLGACARRSRSGRCLSCSRILHVHRRQPQGVPRLLHRGALRGRHRARGLGSEGDPRRPGADRRSLRDRQGRRALSDRRAHQPAAHRVDALRPRPDPHPQAAAARRGDPAPDRQGRAARLYADAAQPALREGTHQARGRRWRRASSSTTSAPTSARRSGTAKNSDCYAAADFLAG